MTIHAPPRAMKRSSRLCLTTAMASAGLALNACDQAANWDSSPAAREPVPAFAYQSVDQCKVADEVPDAECDKGAATALADETNAPRYQERASCEEVYGPGNCVPRSAGGSNFFGPLLTGFVIGRMLDGGGSPFYRGSGLYRDRYGEYRTPYGATLGRDYTTGRTTIARTGVDPSPVAKQAPPRVQTRSQVVSRSGFGGGSRGYGG
jgi:uncharacterized protein YgiB involved in biofilm formation